MVNPSTFLYINPGILFKPELVWVRLLHFQSKLTTTKQAKVKAAGLSYSGIRYVGDIPTLNWNKSKQVLCFIFVWQTVLELTPVLVTFSFAFAYCLLFLSQLHLRSGPNPAFNFTHGIITLFLTSILHNVQKTVFCAFGTEPAHHLQLMFLSLMVTVNHIIVQLFKEDVNIWGYHSWVWWMQVNWCSVKIQMDWGAFPQIKIIILFTWPWHPYSSNFNNKLYIFQAFKVWNSKTCALFLGNYLQYKNSVTKRIEVREKTNC